MHPDLPRSARHRVSPHAVSAGARPRLMRGRSGLTNPSQRTVPIPAIGGRIPGPLLPVPGLPLHSGGHLRWQIVDFGHGPPGP